MARTDARAVLGRLRELTTSSSVGPDGSGEEPRVRAWLEAADELTADLVHDGLVAPADLAARATAARAWLEVRGPKRLGDDDWAVWRFAREAVFRRPGARVFVDEEGVRLLVEDEEVLYARAPGPLTDARVDVPTGRGFRTGRARKPAVRVELRGTRLTVHGPAELLYARQPGRLAPGGPPIDVEW